MNRLTKQVIIFTAGFIAFFAILGIASNMDYTEQVIYAMPQELYEQIASELGQNSNDYQIAKRYLANKKYYDSLKH